MIYGLLQLDPDGHFFIHAFEGDFMIHEAAIKKLDAALRGCEVSPRNINDVPGQLIRGDLEQGELVSISLLHTCYSTPLFVVDQ